MKELFRTHSIIKAIEDCHIGYISLQLQKFKELGGFGTTHQQSASSCRLLAASNDRERLGLFIISIYSI